MGMVVVGVVVGVLTLTGPIYFKNGARMITATKNNIIYFIYTSAVSLEAIVGRMNNYPIWYLNNRIYVQKDYEAYIKNTKVKSGLLTEVIYHHFPSSAGGDIGDQ